LRKLAALLLAAAAFAIAGCGNDENGAEGAEGEETTISGQAPFDRAFIDAMVPHHQAAIEMARGAKQAGLSQPELISIANDIVATQQVEIDQMLAWREQWFGSAEPGPQEAALETLGLTPVEAGMEHGDVDLASVDDVDQTFAGMMIGHHVGAIRMAELAETEADHDEMKELAGEIITAQQREIDVMEKHASGEHG
jgi:uncharacterized protein (DUF305 family)